MNIDLIDLSPDQTRNKLWISDLFQCSARIFNGSISDGTFPIFIVQGSTNIRIENRSINNSIFSKLNSNGHKFGLVHIMDENYDHDLSIYNMVNCIIVFREYYRPIGGISSFFLDFLKSFFLPTYVSNKHASFFRLAADLNIRFRGKFGVLEFMKRQYLPSLPSTKEIMYFPLGCTDGVFRRKQEMQFLDKKISDRTYRWCFCGQSGKKDRGKMISCLKSSRPYYLHETDVIEVGTMLSGQDYFDILTKSIFVPCPIGNINRDTYRLFEALEAGSIPIFIKTYAFQPYDYYKYSIGVHPLPVFNSWEEAGNFVNTSSDNYIEKLSIEIRNWYENHIINYKQKISNTLSNCQ